MQPNEQQSNQQAPVSPQQQDYQHPPANNQTSTITIVGFILAFFLPLVGLILSVIALRRIKKTGEGGKALAIAGIVISSVSLIISTLILASLTLTTFNGTQRKARNSERVTDINALQSQIEAYYSVHNMYPTLANLNDPSWRSTNMSGLDSEALKDPQGANPQLSSTPSKETYSYAPLGKDNADCDNIKSACTIYKLSTALESASYYEKSNLNIYSQ